MCFGQIDTRHDKLTKISAAALDAAKKIGNSLDRAHVKSVLAQLPDDEIEHLAQIAETLADPAHQSGRQMAHLLRDIIDDEAFVAGRVGKIEHSHRHAN